MFVFIGLKNISDNNDLKGVRLQHRQRANSICHPCYCRVFASHYTAVNANITCITRTHAQNKLIQAYDLRLNMPTY